MLKIYNEEQATSSASLPLVGGTTILSSASKRPWVALFMMRTWTDNVSVPLKLWHSLPSTSPALVVIY